jgi:hypothetical protein
MSSPLKRITDTVFKSLVKDAAPEAASSLVVKSNPSLVSSIEGSRRLLWTISTENVDRMGDVIKVSGWKLENYEKGGSVLWAHNPSMLPVAKPVKTYVEGNVLKSLAEYATIDENPFADSVYKLAKGGFLRGSSIGMRPIKYQLDAARASEEHPYPVMFLEQELLEWSHTPIPANPEALLSAKSIGIDLNPIRAWSEQALDENSLSLLGLRREDVEKAYFVSKDTQSVSVDLSASAESTSPTIPVETKTADECNTMIKALLEARESFREASALGTLDTQSVKETFAFLKSLVPDEAQVEAQAEEVKTPESVEDTTPIYDETKSGFERMNTFSFYDLSEQDIREVARDVISAELRKRKR